MINIIKRKVLFEKHSYYKENLFGMKFCSYQSNKESLLIVNFKPLIAITSEIHIDQFDCVSQKFTAVDLKIVDSIDNNGSQEFMTWIKQKHKKGVDMFFYKLNSNEYCPVLALRGCSLEKYLVDNDVLNISVNFFAYSWGEENC